MQHACEYRNASPGCCAPFSLAGCCLAALWSFGPVLGLPRVPSSTEPRALSPGTPSISLSALPAEMLRSTVPSQPPPCLHSPFSSRPPMAVGWGNGVGAPGAICGSPGGRRDAPSAEPPSGTVLALLYF